MARRRAIAVVGVSAVLASAVVAWWVWPTEQRRAVDRFARSACLAPHADEAAHVHAWNSVVPLEGGKSVTVLASGRMNTMFELAFSDEDDRRQVTSWWDYTYPRDARVERSAHTLWLVISGGLGNHWPFRDRARLYEYDLRSRTIARELDLDSEELPAACAATKRRL